ncbi:MAG: phosphoribosylanthranilate isomerase [Porticoccaceae bacterium]|nr:phosphoribosylanthranilate isomerase [Porticoccaceae bacterium]
MTSVAVKICGITSSAQARMVASAGADAIGLVLYDKSSRHVDLDLAIEIKNTISEDVVCIALLVNAEEKFVREVISKLSPHFIQFHGDESPNFCHQFNYPFIRAIRMSKELKMAKILSSYKPSGGFLFDAWHADHYGGTGHVFDWNRLPVNLDFPLILAGGLNPDNVSSAVRAVGPAMVDVSGGVESSPGVKDEHKVREFILNAKEASLKR